MALSPIFRRPLESLGFLAPIGGLDDTDPNDAAPIRQSSPESPDTPPVLGEMISRSPDTIWLGSFMDVLQTNEDPMLLRDGTGLNLYEALLSDEVAMSSLQQRRLAITSKEYEVVPGDDKDPASVKAADDFRAMIDALGFDRVTGGLHYAVWFGYAVGECIWTMKDYEGRTIVWLQDIVVPDRRWFGFTVKGELRYTAGYSGGVAGEVLPDNKFVTVRTGASHDFAFYGLGLAHWCYWPIFFKRAALQGWGLYLEKLGRPTVAVGFMPEDKDNAPKRAELLAAGMAIGRDSAVLVPANYLENKLFQVIESSKSGANVAGFKDFVTENNEAVMRVVLGQPGTSKGVSSGLNSKQSDTHAAVKEEIVKADSDLITDAIGSTVGRWVTAWNHGPGVKPPIVRRILKAGEDLSVTAERDKTLADIGIKRTEDSVKATYGDGYEVAETLPTASLKQIAQSLGGSINPETGTVIPAAPAPAAASKPAFGAESAFTAADDEAIDRLIAASVDKSSPLFAAIATAMKGALQGVETVEGARVAILSAVEQFNPTDLAKALALPLLAERAAATIGKEDEVVG